MRKIVQGAAEVTRMLPLGSGGGVEARPPTDTHHKNLLNASERGKTCSRPRWAVCKGAVLAAQPTRAALPHLEATPYISKAPGLLIRWKPDGVWVLIALSESRRGSTRGNHRPPALSAIFLWAKRISGAFPPPFYSPLLTDLPQSLPFHGHKNLQNDSWRWSDKSKHRGHCKCPCSAIILKLFIY